MFRKLKIQRLLNSFKEFNKVVKIPDNIFECTKKKLLEKRNFEINDFHLSVTLIRCMKNAALGAFDQHDIAFTLSKWLAFRRRSIFINPEQEQLRIFKKLLII